MASVPVAAPKDEKVIAAHHALMMAVRTVLPAYFDDISLEFGPKKYEEMLADYEVGSSFDTLKLSVLDDGWRLEPAIEKPRAFDVKKDESLKAKAERAQEIADFARDCLDGLEGDFLQNCNEMLDACAVGWRSAEVVYKDGEGAHAGKVVLKAIKPKPNKHVAFIVDEFANILGLAVATVDKPLPPIGTVFGSDTIGDISTLARDRALIFTYEPKDSDPRGRSILRKAYNPWFVKTKVIPAWFKYLNRFGEPGVVGKVSPESPDLVPKVDDTTGAQIKDGDDNLVYVSPEWALREQLLKWVNALVVALPAGYEVDLLEATGDGKAFDYCFAWCDRAITRAILGTAQTTQEAQHESRSSKQVGQDITGLRTRRIRSELAAAVQRDVVRPLVLFNFGQEGLDLMPTLVFTNIEQQDFSEELKAVSQAYAAGFIHDSQLPELDARLGLPERDMDAMEKEKQDQAQMDRLANGFMDTALNPARKTAPPSGA